MQDDCSDELFNELLHWARPRCAPEKRELWRTCTALVKYPQHHGLVGRLSCLAHWLFHDHAYHLLRTSIRGEAPSVIHAAFLDKTQLQPHECRELMSHVVQCVEEYEIATWYYALGSPACTPDVLLHAAERGVLLAVWAVMRPSDDLLAHGNFAAVVVAMRICPEQLFRVVGFLEQDSPAAQIIDAHSRVFID